MIHNTKHIYLILILFFSLVYPLFHNLFTFVTINSYNFLFGFNPLFNLLSIGLKDILILIILFLLLLRNNVQSILLILLLLLCLIFYNISIIKQITLPFLLVATLYFYRENIFIVFTRHKKFFNSILVFLSLITISFAWYEYAIRLNFYNFDLITLSMEIKCSKNLLISNEAFNLCLGSMQNSYKIDQIDNEYIRLEALFMPAGDSVSLSFILFNLMFYFTVFYNSRFKNFLILITAVSILFTFSRYIAFFTIIFLFYHFVLKRNGFSYFLIVILIFLLNINYYILSLFKSSIPSNIGHLESINSATSMDLSMYIYLMIMLLAGLILSLLKYSKLNFSITFSITFLLSLILKMYFFNEWSFFEGSDMTPSESNFLKALSSFGLVGIGLYSYILAILFYMLKNKNPYTFFIIMMLLLYQFIAPYVISGFVVFFPAFTLALLSFSKYKNETNKAIK